MAWMTDRQFKTCDKCGRKIQVDTAVTGYDEDGKPITTESEEHLGSCDPQPEAETSTP